MKKFYNFYKPLIINIFKFLIIYGGIYSVFEISISIRKILDFDSDIPLILYYFISMLLYIYFFTKKFLLEFSIVRNISKLKNFLSKLDMVERIIFSIFFVITFVKPNIINYFSYLLIGYLLTILIITFYIRKHYDNIL